MTRGVQIGFVPASNCEWLREVLEKFEPARSDFQDERCWLDKDAVNALERKARELLPKPHQE